MSIETQSVSEASAAASSQGSQSLTREQLLSALDFEIVGATAAKAAVGRTRWAVLLALAGLTWVALQNWEADRFDLRRTVILTIALTQAWEFVLQIGQILDKSLSAHQLTGKVFLALSDLLGALRSSMMFELLQHVGVIAATIWLAIPQLRILQWCTGFRLVADILGLYMSWAASFYFPRLTAPKLHLLYIFHLVITWVFRIACVASATAPIWQHLAPFTTPDLRLALIVVAMLYLLSLLFHEQLPSALTTALRSTRQNLAFGRITLDQARNHADFLLVGIGLAQALQRPFQAFSESLEKTRVLLATVHSTFDKAKELLAQPEVPDNHDTPSTTSQGLRLCDSLEKSLSVVEANYRLTEKRLTQLNDKRKLLVVLSGQPQEDAGFSAEALQQAIDLLKSEIAAVKASLDNVRSRVDAALNGI